MTMRAAVHGCLLAVSVAAATACRSAPSECGPAPDAKTAENAGSDLVNLSGRLADRRLTILNRAATPLAGGGIRVTAAPGVGLIWIDGTDFAEGTIEADVCGRDVYSESFIGLAFHARDHETYEAVYLRPFNFRSRSEDRRQHAVQYVAMPDDDYARLRARFPGEFEKAVDPAIAPTAWNRLRIVVRNGRVQAFVGPAEAPALDVRALRPAGHGPIGLYVDNGSDGVFANLRVAAARDGSGR